MQTDNFDKQIAEKLKNRRLSPSGSAWERLSNQLDEVDQSKRKNKIVVLGYVASILLLVSIGVFYLKGETSNSVEFPKEEIITKTDIKVKENEILETTIKEDIQPVVLAKTDEVEKNKTTTIPVDKTQDIELSQEEFDKKIAFVKAEIKDDKLQITKQESIKDSVITQKIESVTPTTKRIYVNADDLLYAVTHTPEEVKDYYAKYNINRNDIIDTIRYKLRKSNLKIDPEVILAEVESSIDESYYQENFMDKFKSKLSQVIVAIAERNN
ncbi:hypothetical protein [Tenacibaculum jejuense]|uniref:Uncharacterized protein n=1 Tax=Tenacibaculum jejuense TaxID=584609 RepID=A0A238UAF4_9FLAO|nr:hypothetical protein [Tenacibaculum jejuense]SNR16082.1 Probable transmembrane protein of unknown function; putative anti ECF-type sigma factor [Tenacibaculum jejuense]